LKELISSVLKKIKPSSQERRKVKKIADEILSSVKKAAKNLGIPAEVILVGSIARDTWITGKREIDIFILLPEEFSREELEEKGLEIGRKVARKWEERYAEHPYIHAFWKGYEVDLVPCYKVSSPEKIKSAVDRTPFHSEFITKNIGGMEEDVILLKQFMAARNVYGAEQKVEGFSGYLCELLILYYKSFQNFLSNASKWRYGERIDLLGNGKYKGKDPLIVIDPVDPNRNAAAAVSLESMARVIDSSREFLKNPSEDFFFPRKIAPLSRREARKIQRERGTTFIWVTFELPKLVDDIIFPQLRKTERSLINLIERNGFRVYGSKVFRENERGMILLELEIAELPKIKRHVGPPVTSKHSERFKKKYEGRYISDGRWVADVPRKYVRAIQLVKKELPSCKIGKNLAGCRYKVEEGLPEGCEELLRKYLCKF
jgi:tRNA nucleotidyltransferase (CCA-adding enzyme)